MKMFALALAAAFAAPATAQESLTVEQCVTILSGLNALNCVGQQLQGQCAPDAKQYKLGDARFTIASDVQALSGVLTSYQRAQQQFMAELPPLPPAPQGDAKPEPQETALARADQNKRAIANQIAMLGKPCPVTPGRLKLSELKLGDAADQNAIPPAVLAAFSLIVDKQ